MVVAIVCVGILGMLVFALGFAVSMARRRFRIASGCPDDPTHVLLKRVRAHGNTCEYAPMLAVLILFLGLHAPGPMVQGLMILATASRVLIVVGILISPTLAKPHPLRLAGALGTYLGGVALALAAVFTVMQ